MMMCRSIQSVLVMICVITLSHHIQIGKSQTDGKLVCMYVELNHNREIFYYMLTVL